MIYNYPTAKTRTLYKSTDGCADNRPNTDGLGDIHRTVPELTVRVYWQPGQATFKSFSSDPDRYPRPQGWNVPNTTSAKNISVRAEWLRQSGRAPSEPSETPRWRITPCPASRSPVMLHIALWSPFRRFFSLCWSPILNKQSEVVANCDHMSEWVHWVHDCIGIAMQWVMLRKSLLTFLLH